MSKLPLLFLTTLAIAACGKKSNGGTEEAISKMTDMKTRMCACKDAACVATILMEYKTWSEKFAESKKGQDNMSDEQDKKIDGLLKEMDTCSDKVTGSAETPPPAGSAAAAPPPAGDHAKSTEAPLMLNLLDKNVKVAFVVNAEFPKGKAASLPAADCCKTAGKCASEKDAFAKDAVWAAIPFSVDDPGQFHYTYESTDGKTFHAEASGDPDCSGKMITYKLDGTIEAGNAKINLTEP